MRRLFTPSRFWGHMDSWEEATYQEWCRLHDSRRWRDRFRRWLWRL